MASAACGPVTWHSSAARPGIAGVERSSRPLCGLRIREIARAAINRKRMRRLYRLEGLQVRMRVRRRTHGTTARAGAHPDRPKKGWSMDFVRDALADGRLFRAQSRRTKGGGRSTVVWSRRRSMKALPVDHFPASVLDHFPSGAHRELQQSSLQPSHHARERADCRCSWGTPPATVTSCQWRVGLTHRMEASPGSRAPTSLRTRHRGDHA